MYKRQPLDRTVVSPPPAAGADETAAVRVKLSDGTVSEMTMADYLWRVAVSYTHLDVYKRQSIILSKTDGYILLLRIQFCQPHRLLCY